MWHRPHFYWHWSSVNIPSLATAVKAIVDFCVISPSTSNSIAVEAVEEGITVQSACTWEILNTYLCLSWGGPRTRRRGVSKFWTGEMLKYTGRTERKGFSTEICFNQDARRGNLP